MAGTLTSFVETPMLHRPAPLCSVHTVTDDAAFLALEAEWNETVERARITHPFLRHEWLRTWWECFGSGCQLHIVIVRAEGRIVAIAPLMSDTTRMYGIPIRRLRLLHNDHTPRADFIVADRAEESYRAIWDALHQQRDSWDVLQLSQVPQQSRTLGLVSTMAIADGCSTGVWRSSDAPYLELRGTWDQYFESLTSKFRQNVRNRLTRLNRLGEPASKPSGSAPRCSMRARTRSGSRLRDGRSTRERRSAPTRRCIASTPCSPSERQNTGGCGFCS